MYIIMYKYSTFKIKRKSFRSSMSKNFPVTTDRFSPSSPAPTGDPSYNLMKTKSRPSAETASGTKRMIISLLIFRTLTRKSHSR